MKKRVLFLSFIFLSVICKATTVYVSASHGDDANDGLTQINACKTVAGALAKGDTILLKAGDVFYTKGITLRSKIVSRYGLGNNPIICGYKRINEPNWEIEGKNIWSISLAKDNYSGLVLIGSSMSNNIGCLHEYDKDLIHGHKVQYLTDLNEDWDIWQTNRYDGNTPASAFDKLYLYYEGNPNELNIEFSISDIAINMRQSAIDGVDICGYGFGIYAESQSIIKNCKIDAIGGHVFIGYDVFTCYGNGIEIWSGSKNCLVENCVISRCYDCGCSIQGRSGTPQNICFRSNVIYDCCQGWEDFISNDDPKMIFSNCVFENNIVLNSGYTAGFGYTKNRIKYCHILGNNYKGNKGMIIRNNTFVGGNFYCSGAFNNEYKSNVWEGNTCIVRRGDYILSNYLGTKDVIRIPTNKGNYKSLKAATKDAINRYRELTGDETTTFLIKSERRIFKKINRIKKKILGNESSTSNN